MPGIAGGDEGEYVLRVQGDSMKDAGILEGDHVVVRPQDTATTARSSSRSSGSEATVKRFFKEDDHIRLQPENEALEPIRSPRGQVLGRVVGGLQEGVMTPRSLDAPGGCARRELWRRPGRQARARAEVSMA